MAETIDQSGAWIRGKISRIGCFTGPDARKQSDSDRVLIETVYLFLLENNPYLYTKCISIHSSHDNIAAVVLAQVGDEVAFRKIEDDEVGDFSNLTLLRQMTR